MKKRTEYKRADNAALRYIRENKHFVMLTADRELLARDAVVSGFRAGYRAARRRKEKGKDE